MRIRYGLLLLLFISGLTACGSSGGSGDTAPAANNNVPTPVISSAQNSPTASNPIIINIDFGESVTGLILSEISVSNGTAANLIDIDGQNYTVEITPAADGEVQVSLAAGITENAAAIANLAFNSFSIIYQSTGVIVYYQENFNAFADDAAWPAPWVVANNSPVVSATIQSGQACLEGDVLTDTMDPEGQNNLARIVNVELSVQDFEVRYEIIYDDFQNQGGGFYGRQNGEFLLLNAISGQGYGFFLKGFLDDQLMLWYEISGDEIPHEEVNIENTALNITQGSLGVVHFNVAYQVQQISATETQQRAKIWLDGNPEPADWQIVSDAVGSELPGTNPMTIPALQNLSDGFAIDLFNFSNPTDGVATTQSMCVDNIVITAL